MQTQINSQSERFLNGEVNLEQLTLETIYLMIQQKQLSFDQFEDWVYYREHTAADDCFFNHFG